MTSDEIRRAFLQFFEEKGHKVIPSSSLVPKGDPTLLLTTAGMVQIKPYFLGEAIPPHPRLASCQKCFRTTDIDCVGDSRHLTFFEMLGNFSVGDYFKKEAISWAWEFVTQRLRLPLERLWITVYQDDDESFQYWREIGVPAERIVRCGEKDNFWGPAGDSGPCGPCSEIHYDVGEDAGCGRENCAPGCDCGRFLEIWNLVFTQYNQDKKGNRTPLPKPNIDTGMGLERTAAVMQGKGSVYETDRFLHLLNKVCQLAGQSYGKDEVIDRAVRIVAEHSRGIAFLIADGVFPSNDGRGYVLRRVLRRAALFGRKLGLDKPFLAEVAEAIIAQMGHLYPELVENRDFVLRVIQLEEERFAETADKGSQILKGLINYRIRHGGAIPELIEFTKEYQPASENASRILEQYGFIAYYLEAAPFEQVGEEMAAQSVSELFYEALRSQEEETSDEVEANLCDFQEWSHSISGREVFILRDTYGFPVELTAEIAKEQGFSLDMAGFEAEMERQRERGRAVQKFALGEKRTMLDYSGNNLPATEFHGYEQTSCEARLLSLAVAGQKVDIATAGEEVEIVLDKTPFYAEKGGQVGDTGRILGKKGTVEVSEALWARADLIAHRGKVIEGIILKEETVRAEVDREGRLDIARNHTATHLLQAALRQVLGSQVYQRGSLVAPDRLRFDFSQLIAPKPEELMEVQRWVNDKILHNLPVLTRITSYKEATEKGAIALFDEKYGEEVRVVQIGEPRVSMELCGGTHLSATGEIGYFQLLGESSIGSGLRRIEATTGRCAEAFLGKRLSILEEVSRQVGGLPDEAQDKVAALLADLETERKRSQALERELGKRTAESLLKNTEEIEGVTVLAAKVPSSSLPALREMGDLLREKLKKAVIVLGTVYEDKPSFLALVTPDLLSRGFHAGEIVKQVAKVTGGGGGGKPEMAQAGGKDKDKVEEALRLVKKIVAEKSRQGA